MASAALPGQGRPRPHVLAARRRTSAPGCSREPPVQELPWRNDVCRGAPPRQFRKADREQMQRIEHVVVLMLENRSFDNLLGQLYPKSVDFDGLDLTESNPWHKPDGSVEEIRAWSSAGPEAPRLPDRDPGEFFEDFNMQIFGSPGAAQGCPTMTGFVDNYMLQPPQPPRSPRTGQPRSSTLRDPPDPKAIMHQYTPAQMPVISSLARAFGVSDRWHASAPCETWPNRYFTHAGTAGGYVNNERSHFPYRWPRFLPTIFRRLDSRGYSWRIYFHDLPQAATLVDLWPKILTRFCLYEDEFERHATSGRLPNYSFIEPRYYPSRSAQAIPNDQHPPHHLRYGEQLIASVYNAVRAAPTWERTLLVVTYDEHGGCFDHVAPPAAVSPGGPYPDGFKFDRYGVRVPALIISPFVKAGSVIRPPTAPGGEAPYPFDHCSDPGDVAQALRSWAASDATRRRSAGSPVGADADSAGKQRARLACRRHTASIDGGNRSLRTQPPQPAPGEPSQSSAPSARGRCTFGGANPRAGSAGAGGGISHRAAAGLSGRSLPPLRRLRGEGGANSRLAKRRAYPLNNDRQPADDEIVRKSQDAKSGASKPGVSLGVPDLGCRRLVRAAIGFDDELSRKTNEVREIGSDRRLPAKAVSVDLMIANRAPKHGLRSRHVLTLRPSELARGLSETGRLVHLVYLPQAQPLPQLAVSLLGKVARSAGWGVARRRRRETPCRNGAANLHCRSPAFHTPSGAPRHLPRLRGEGGANLSTYRKRDPFPSLLGKVARRAGWGVARRHRRETPGRNAAANLHCRSLASTPHPAPSATPPGLRPGGLFATSYEEPATTTKSTRPREAPAWARTKRQGMGAENWIDYHRRLARRGQAAARVAKHYSI